MLPRPELLADLRKCEGLELTAYPDPLSPLAVAIRQGVTDAAKLAGLSGDPWTDGYGHTGKDVTRGLSITLDQAEQTLAADAAIALADAYRTWPWFQALSPVRQDAVANLVFNIGLRKLLQFKHFLDAMGRGAWEEAGDELINSLWYKQVGDRGPYIVEMVKTNARPQ